MGIVTGPESCGKTTLTNRLARYFNTVAVEEYAREWIDEHYGQWAYEDLDEFARGHNEQQTWARYKANKILFTDTGAHTTRIFSELYYDKISQTVKDLEVKEKYDLALLLTPEVEWIQDGSRDYGEESKREEIFTRFKELGAFS